ncbi:MAG: class I mannose-6-phosphate isomerase [Spirochaetia bacterium]|nr:class I mannose-6-phosphate isomerase [Spirochaetia bacterium]
MPEFHPYPMKFKPILKEKIWGGKRLKPVFLSGPGNIGEAWLLSDRDGERSVAVNGTYRGMDISYMMRKYGRELLGEKLYGKYGASYPLLLKLIDTNGRLSVQVHPDDAYAVKKGLDRGKTEVWYILGASKNAGLYAGFRRGTGKKEIKKALSTGKLPGLLKGYTPKKGECYFIPAGTVHYIGAGCSILEIQQNSDTTYRLYDWGRTGREIRPVDALESIKNVNGAGRVTPRKEASAGGVSRRLLVESDYFRVSELVVEKGCSYWYNDNTHCLITVADGLLRIVSGGRNYDFKNGNLALIPYVLTGFVLKAQKKSRLIITEVK